MNSVVIRQESPSDVAAIHAVMKEALRGRREQGAAGGVLLGEPAHDSGLGFKAASGLVLPEVPPEDFQALAFGTSWPRGVVTYHEAFRARGEPSAAGETVLSGLGLSSNSPR